MSIFSTFANTEQNSFEQPFNSFNLNRGNWGMNPNYLTPSYDAPFRPPYGGPGPFPHINQNPGMFTAMAGAAQFTRGPMYGVGNQHYDNVNFDAVGNRTMDAAAGVSQRIIFPVAAWALASGINSHFRTGIATGGARAFYGGMAGIPAAVGSFMRGGSAAEIGTAFNAAFAGAGVSQSLGAGIGERLFTGLGRGAMAGVGHATGLNIAGSAAGRFGLGALGIGGSVMGSIAGPLALAYGATKAADYFLFDNYASVREGQNLTRRNFQGVTFGGGWGDVNGGGLNRQMSARLGGSLAQLGARDTMFTGRDMNTMLDMGSQMGLFDDASAGQIKKRMEGLSAQVKLIMSIAQTPSVQEAVQMLARFKSGGANMGQATMALGSISGLASAAGISATRMINTVGSQGQYLFQSNGLSGFQGQIAGAQAMASFASAFRSGAISPALMAQMGGVEGATQSAITATVNGMQNPYNMMRLANRYMTGMTASSVIGTVSNFGQAMSRNPMDMYGSMMLNRGMMLSDQLRNPQALIDMVSESLATNPVTRGRKGSAGEYYSMMVGQYGMSPQEAQAAIARQFGMQDPRSGSLAIAGINRNRLDMARDYHEQQGNTLASSLVSPLTKAFRSGKAAVAGWIGSALGTTGGITDSLQAWYLDKFMGSNQMLLGTNYSDLEESRGYSEFGPRAGIRDKVGRFSGEASRINDLARQGNTDAKAVLTAESASGRRNALYKLAKSGLISDKFADPEMNLKLAEGLGELTRTNQGGSTGYSDFVDRMGKLGGMEGKDLSTQYQLIAAARRLGSSENLDSEQSRADANLLVRSGMAKTGHHSDVMDAADKIRTSARLARISLDDPFAEFGGSVEQALAAANDPSQRHKVFNKGSRFEKAFLEANDETSARNALAGGLIEKNNLSVRGPTSRYTNANETNAQYEAFLSQDKARRDQIGQIQKAMKEGKIDFSAGYGMINNIDMSGAVDKFGEYVEGFGRAVSGIPGYKPVSPVNAPGGSIPGPGARGVGG